MTFTSLRSLVRLGAFTGAAAILLSLPTAATAQTAVRNSAGNVNVSGLTDFGQYIVRLNDVPKSRRASASVCGIIALRTSSTYPITSNSSFNFNGTNHSMSALPVGATPRCTNGALAEAPAASAFKDSNNVVYFANLTPYSSHSITHNDVPTTRSARASACGMIGISNSPTSPVSGSITILQGTNEIMTFNHSNLTQKPLPLCSQGIGYFPENWSWGS